MTTRRRKSGEQFSPRDPNADTPTQEDDADILAEAGAELDADIGELMVDEATVRDLGAVDATSVRENRRLDRVVQKKREGKKDVPFNTKDPIVIYGALLRHWTLDSIAIKVIRLLGGASVMLNRPIDGAALHEAILHFHGQHAETEYEIKFLSAGKYMGIGRITMPDTRAAAQQGQQSMSNGAPPPQPYYPPQQVPAQPQATDPMAMMGQMFDLFQKMQMAKTPQPPPGYAPPPTVPQVAPTDPVAMMSQMFDMFQRTLAGQQQPAPVPAPPQPVAPPPPPPTPPAPQPSEFERMTQMFELFQRMQASAAPAPPRSGPYSGPRSPNYNPQGDAPPYARPPGPPQPPPRQQTAAEQFREAITFVRTATDAVQEMRSLLPDQEQRETFTAEEDEDNPIRIMETGKMKLAFGKTDGAMRWTETGMMALPEVLKWIGDQHELIQQSARKRQQPPPVQQLPPGYVEVTPGYQPPPGYRAVPVDQQDLPPPPEHVPPPIEQAPAPRTTWGAPVIPDSEEENR